MTKSNFASLLNNPAVESISDERHLGSPIFLYLKDGYSADETEYCGTITGDTVAELKEQLKFVVEMRDPEATKTAA